MLLPVYGREITSAAPWCSRWWEHQEAVAMLHGLWLAWAELTGPGSGMCGPANWHRDYLGPVMQSLRDPSGPFMRLQARQPPGEGGTDGGLHRPVRPAAADAAAAELTEDRGRPRVSTRGRPRFLPHARLRP